jgi:hypothetical protein
MGRFRFRIRSLMVIVAFVALVIMVITQGVFLSRATVRVQIYQAIAEQERANAQIERDRAAVQAIRARELADQAREREERGLREKDRQQ